MQMSPVEFCAAVRALAKEIGPKAEISVVFGGPLTLYGMVRANGWVAGGEVSFAESADTYEDLLKAIRGKWATFEVDHDARRTRALALEIIRITAELGECTDAQIRGSTKFTDAEITRYGEAACADANEIAGKGPFAITVHGYANSNAEAA